MGRAEFHWNQWLKTLDPDGRLTVELYLAWQKQAAKAVLSRQAMLDVMFGRPWAATPKK